MSNLLVTGTELDVRVVKVVPFGCLVVTSDGVNGLVRGATAVTGGVLRVRVIDYDAEQQRFSAQIA